MEAISLVLLLTLIWKVVDILKFGLARDVNAVVTQLVVWLAAIGILALAANADLAAGVEVFGGNRLGDLDFGSIILAGLLVGSGASGLVDVKKAIDGSDSAAVPPLTQLPSSHRSLPPPHG